MRKSANAVLLAVIASVHASAGSLEWDVLFFALLFSLTGAVVSTVTGAVGLAVLFSLASLFLFVALWTRELE